jgi:hypothetical protein
MTSVQVVTRGGAFLIQETPIEAVFIPEEWNDEQKQLAKLHAKTSWKKRFIPA